MVQKKTLRLERLKSTYFRPMHARAPTYFDNVNEKKKADFER